MKLIKGKRYYVSIGYIDKKEHPKIDAEFIESIIMDCKDGTVYADGNTVIPLMPINQIQRKDNKFIFRFLFFPFKAKFCNSDEPIRHNVYGLFEVTRDNDEETIRFLNFYETETHTYFYREKSKSLTLTFHVDEKELMEVN